MSKGLNVIKKKKKYKFIHLILSILHQRLLVNILIGKKTTAKTLRGNSRKNMVIPTADEQRQIASRAYGVYFVF